MMFMWSSFLYVSHESLGKFFSTCKLQFSCSKKNFPSHWNMNVFNRNPESSLGVNWVAIYDQLPGEIPVLQKKITFIFYGDPNKNKLQKL